MGLTDEESEDLAQKVLVRVYLYAARARFERVKEVWAWVYAITAREVYKRWRGKRPSLVRQDVLARLADGPDDCRQSPLDAAATSEELADLDECIGRLGTADRLCFLGPLVARLTFRQAAAAMQMSLGQLKHRYEKALRQVRRCMEGKGHHVE